jgi:hypothetical protein
MLCSPLYFQQLTVLRSHTPPSTRQSTRSNSPVSAKETHSEPTFCIAWERHCAWSLRLSHICESPEISRSGEGGAQQSIRFATECVCGFPVYGLSLLQKADFPAKWSVLVYFTTIIFRTSHAVGDLRLARRAGLSH